MDYINSMSDWFRLTASRWRSIVAFFLWTVLFAVAYAQSPLYTSNQNQYFLHGLAQAGFGNLSRDWLANTSDPTPVFSLLVAWTYQIIASPPIYYLYYALLMGVYLFSLLGITSSLYGWQDSRQQRIFFMVLIIAVNSAAWRFGVSRTLGVDWTYVLEDGFAGQRMLGPVLQPSAFGVFLLLSIYLFLKARPYLAALSAVLAATVHPTYLLSAATLTGSFMLVIFLQERDYWKSLLVGLLALVFISPTLYAALSVFRGSSPIMTAQARQILVTFRIPHHAIPAEWFNLSAVTKILLIILSLHLIRRSRLFPVVLISVLVALGLTLIQISTNSDALALLFPWRLSVYILPLSTAVVLGCLVEKVVNIPAFQPQARRKWLLVASYVLISVVVIIGAIRFTLDLGRKNAVPEQEMQAYVTQNLGVEDIYLTPVKMQDFRLVTGAPVYVDFKSIPYRDSEVIEWHRRVQLVDRFYESGDCDMLETIVQEGGVTHVVAPREARLINCPVLKPIYQDELYRIYIIMPNGKSTSD